MKAQSNRSQNAVGTLRQSNKMIITKVLSIINCRGYDLVLDPRINAELWQTDDPQYNIGRLSSWNDHYLRYSTLYDLDDTFETSPRIIMARRRSKFADYDDMYMYMVLMEARQEDSEFKIDKKSYIRIEGHLSKHVRTLPNVPSIKVRVEIFNPHIVENIAAVTNTLTSGIEAIQAGIWDSLETIHRSNNPDIMITEDNIGELGLAGPYVNVFSWEAKEQYVDPVTHILMGDMVYLGSRKPIRQDMDLYEPDWTEEQIEEDVERRKALTVSEAGPMSAPEYLNIREPRLYVQRKLDDALVRHYAFPVGSLVEYHRPLMAGADSRAFVSYIFEVVE